MKKPLMPKKDFLDGYNFQQPALLEKALTHISVSIARKNRKKNYERLEFLGDRVLGLVCAEMLLEAFPRENEGKIARRHAALVQGATIAKVMESLDVKKHIAVHKDTTVTDAIMADVGEAIIAALYLDGGLQAAAKFIKKNWRSLLEADLTAPKDAKSRVQEWAQAKGYELPQYEVLQTSGSDHKPVFEIRASLEDYEAVGKGASKKVAERNAAKALWTEIHS